MRNVSAINAMAAEGESKSKAGPINGVPDISAYSRLERQNA